MDIFNFRIPPYPQLVWSDWYKFKKGEKHSNRYAPVFVLLFVFEGELLFTEDGKHVSVKRNEWYIQQPHLLQEGKRPCNNPAKYYYIHTKFDNWERLESENNYISSVIVEDGGTDHYDGNVHQITLPVQSNFNPINFLSLFEYLNKQNLTDITSKLQAQATLIQIFYQMVLENMHNKADVKSRLSDRVINYMTAHFTEGINVKSIENEFHFSHDHINRLVKRDFGFNLIDYLTKLKINRAKELLIYTNLNIKNIADQTGFASTSTLYKAFINKVGVSPSAYRKQHNIF